MKREWKPGDVAMVRDTYSGSSEEWRAVKDDKGWAGLDPEIGWVGDNDVTSARPLVVLDPEDGEQVERLATEIVRLALARGDVVRQGKDATARRVGHIQDALRSLTAPPKPDEPQGRYAVVLDSENVEWIRSRNGAWCYALISSGSGISDLTRWRVKAWDDIDAVKILSEGVTA